MQYFEVWRKCIIMKALRGENGAGAFEVSWDKRLVNLGLF